MAPPPHFDKRRSKNERTVKKRRLSFIFDFIGNVCPSRGGFAGNGSFHAKMSPSPSKIFTQTNERKRHKWKNVANKKETRRSGRYFHFSDDKSLHTVAIFRHSCDLYIRMTRISANKRLPNFSWFMPKTHLRIKKELIHSHKKNMKKQPRFLLSFFLFLRTNFRLMNSKIGQIFLWSLVLFYTFGLFNMYTFAQVIHTLFCMQRWKFTYVCT